MCQTYETVVNKPVLVFVLFLLLASKNLTAFLSIPLHSSWLILFHLWTLYMSASFWSIDAKQSIHWPLCVVIYNLTCYFYFYFFCRFAAKLIAGVLDFKKMIDTWVCLKSIQTLYCCSNKLIITMACSCFLFVFFVVFFSKLQMNNISYCVVVRLCL